MFSSVAQSCLTLCNAMDCNRPGFPVHHQLLELAPTHVHRVGDAIHHLILYRPLLHPPSVFPSIRVFSSESVLCIRWPKYWSFGFCISPSTEYLGLISFRMDWFDLLAVQGTLKSLLQHHSSKVSILQDSALFIVQFSHPYFTTGKTTAWTRDLCWQVMSLCFLICCLGWLHLFFKEQASFNFMAAVTISGDSGAQENKVCHCFHCFPSYLPWSDRTRCHDLRFLNIEF